MNHINLVKEAAEILALAITQARAAGYRVTFPDHVLVGIPVSETGNVVQPPAAQEPAVPVIGRASKRD